MKGGTVCEVGPPLGNITKFIPKICPRKSTRKNDFESVCSSSLIAGIIDDCLRVAAERFSGLCGGGRVFF